MALVTNVLVGFMALWCLTYLIVYLHFLSSGANDSAVPEVKLPLDAAGAAVHEGDSSIRPPILPSSTADLQFFNPLLSYSCHSYIAEDKASLAGAQAAVVMVVAGEAKQTVLRTAISTASYSGSILAALVVVDNSLEGDIRAWADWHSPVFSSIKIIHLRPPRRLGYAAAREYGVENLHMDSISVIVFADTNLIVSADWLYPLISTLHTHPTSVVYPAVDVIMEEGKELGLIKGDRLVAAFDWELRRVWIPLPSPGSDAVDDDDDIDEAVSPAVHSTFAVSLAFYNQLGGYDPSLPGHLADIELSLRVWLCAGSIIRQPCSRVAQAFPQIKGDTFGEGSVGHYDRSTIGVSHRWMAGYFRDVVFQARYMNRIPSKVTVPLDNLHPEKFTRAKLINDYECLPMDWYLEHVNPSLVSAAETVKGEFSSYMSTEYLSAHLSSLVNQYKKSSQINYVQSTLEKLESFKDKYHNARAEDKDMENVRRNYREEQHLAHQQWVKTTLTCEDENFFGMQGCDKFQANGGCKTDVVYAMFGCPKTCGHCDSKGQLCADYYIKRCADAYRNNPAVCDSDPWTRENCRLTCGFCAMGEERKSNDAAPKVVVESVPKLEEPDKARFDPLLARRRYLAGEIPDEPDENACSLNNRPNGDLLSRVIVEEVPGDAPKVFCGIYTMEKNHPTNVKATMETWAKRCDGFVAFSTVSDEAFSAMRIEHEGEEKYDNMWQKSRRFVTPA